MEQQTVSSLNVINGKSSPYGKKGIIIYDNYLSDTKLGPDIVEIIRIPCSCNACTKISSLYWDSKIKEAFNQPRYGRFI